MITRSNLAEQLREYQIRSKYDWASVSFFSATSNVSSRYDDDDIWKEVTVHRKLMQGSVIAGVTHLPQGINPNRFFAACLTHRERGSGTSYIESVPTSCVFHHDAPPMCFTFMLHLQLKMAYCTHIIS